MESLKTFEGSTGFRIVLYFGVTVSPAYDVLDEFLLGLFGVLYSAQKSSYQLFQEIYLGRTLQTLIFAQQHFFGLLDSFHEVWFIVDHVPNKPLEGLLHFGVDHLR